MFIKKIKNIGSYDFATQDLKHFILNRLWALVTDTFWVLMVLLVVLVLILVGIV